MSILSRMVGCEFVGTADFDLFMVALVKTIKVLGGIKCVQIATGGFWY